MSKNHPSHLRGERGQAFANQIRGIALDRLLCVSLDISKYFHVAVIHTALGEIVTPPFEVDLFQDGFDQLCQAIDAAVAQTRAQMVLVGLEPTGHYFENLARHLLQRPQAVTLLNPYAVKQNREQQMMRRQKADEIDVAAIGDLLRRGEGTPYQPLTGVYLRLQQVDRVRLGKVKLQTLLKNQILGHLDRIFPGLVILGDEATQRYRPLFATNFWTCQTLQHLIRVCPDPRRLAQLAPADLVAAFHARGYALGPVTAAKLITYAQKVLFPDPELVAIRSELLAHDLALLEAVEQHLADLNARLMALLTETPYQIWTTLKGLSGVQTASLAAAMGDPAHYTFAGQVFRRSGLVSGRNDSGTRQRKGQGQRILKSGDVYLRRALMDVATLLILHQPVLRRYYQKLKRRKPAGVARVATARHALDLLWATLRDQRALTLIPRPGGDHVNPSAPGVAGQTGRGSASPPDQVPDSESQAERGPAVSLTGANQTLVTQLGSPPLRGPEPLDNVRGTLGRSHTSIGITGPVRLARWHSGAGLDPWPRLSHALHISISRLSRIRSW